MKNRLKIVMTMTIALLASQVFGQVRIVNSATNAAAINSSAFIDASSNSTTNPTNNIGKGLLFPRTDLTTFSAFSGSPLGLPTAYPTRYDGMIVYNTGTGSTLASASDSIVSVTPGFYYYDNKTTNLKGGKWTRIDATSTDISKLLVQSPAKDSIMSVVSSNGKTLSNGNGILINGGNSLAKSVLADASLRIDSTAIAKMMSQSPTKDSLTTVINTTITSGGITGQNLISASEGALIIIGGTGTSLKSTSISINKDSIVTSIQVSKVLNSSPAKDTFISLINNQITNGSITGQNLTAGSLLQTTGTPTGASLKAAGYQVDTTALKTFVASNVNKAPIKDSITSTIINQITNGSITGQNLTAGTLLQTTGTPTGASLKVAGYQVDTTALKTFVANNVNKAPIKDSITNTIINQITNGSITGQNLTAGTLLQTTGTPTGASLKAAGYQVDTTALKTFVANNVNKSPIKDSITNTITNQITNGSITGQNLTAGTLLQTTGTPTGASLKAAGYQVDTTALKTFVANNVNKSPIKDSITNTITNQITNGSITGQNLTGTGIIVMGGIGTSLKATSLRLDSTSIASIVMQSPVKDSINKLAVASDSSIYKNNGLLTGNRSVFMGSNTLAFDTTTLFINPTTNRIGIGTTNPANKLEIVQGTAGNSGVRITNLPNTPSLATNTSGDIVAGGSLTFGDIKSGFQSADHNGWIRLNGRAISTLTSTQQTIATSLGFTTNLPDASNSVLVQNGSTLGSVSSSNARTIAQNQLPNVTLTGTTAAGGAHSHTSNLPIRPGYCSSNFFPSLLSGDIVAGGSGVTTTNTDGAHSHTFSTTSINGNVTQQTLNVMPQSLSVNVFVYLGN